eukprot:12705876-Alexandrium_andersonii.AAC.1
MCIRDRRWQHSQSSPFPHPPDTPGRTAFRHPYEVQNKWTIDSPAGVPRPCRLLPPALGRSPTTSVGRAQCSAHTPPCSNSQHPRGLTCIWPALPPLAPPRLQ